MGAFDGLRGDQVSHGYWGNHTGSIDWCEDNYTHTPYIAEWYNTLTNFPTILLGLYGAAATLSAGLPKRYALAYLGLTGIGLGSFGFHMTLRWEWQMLDELPMICVVTYGVYLAFDTHPSFKPRFGILGPLAVVAFCAFVSFSYIYLQDPVYHQIAFATLLLSAVGRNAYLVSRIPKGHPSRKMISRTLANGVITFFLSFVIWNIDNVFCDELRAMRGDLGLMGFMLQGHGLWHLGTGYGSFLIFTATGYIQLAIKVSPDAYTYDPKSWFPLVNATPAAQSKAKQATGQKPSEKKTKPPGKISNLVSISEE